MVNDRDPLDPELLQGRWILGGIRPEDLPGHAALALQVGFDGTGLQQLAGLEHPTQTDLDRLPGRAFADMVLKAIDQEEAVSRLLARGLPATHATVTALLQAFPEFSPRWRQHVAHGVANPQETTTICACSLPLSSKTFMNAESLMKRGASSR